MKPRTLYLDTSVIGGCFDDEWKDPTRKLFELAESGVFRLVTSVVAVRELVNAPEEVRQQFASALSDEARILELSTEADVRRHGLRRDLNPLAAHGAVAFLWKSQRP